MKFVLALLLLGLASCLATATAENVDNLKLAIAVLQQAEHEYDQLMLNETIHGAQTKAFGSGRVPGSTKYSPYSEAMSKISNVNERALDLLVTK